MNTNLDFSKTEINRNFIMKVHSVNKYGKNLNVAVGVSGLIKLVGEEMANKFFHRAFNSPEQKIPCKLRRGLRVTFYSR